MCLKELCPMVAAPRTDDVSDVNIPPLLKSLVERVERELSSSTCGNKDFNTADFGSPITKIKSFKTALNATFIQS